MFWLYTLTLFTLIFHSCLSIPIRYDRRKAIWKPHRLEVEIHPDGGIPQKSGAVLHDPPEKYFHESSFHSHYDGRFGDEELPDAERRARLIALVQTYFATMNDLGANTWLMHGSLLGWFWNRRIMPWDTDIDVQISETSMDYLAEFYNMTVHHYQFKDAEGGRDFLLEVNPHYANSSTDDRLNVIDARWIDLSSGLFIDITTLRPNLTAEALGIEGMMMCKDKHHFHEADIYPLRESVFEGVPVKVPYAYAELLTQEYGQISLTSTWFNGYKFDTEKAEWLKVLMPQNGLPLNHPGVPRMGNPGHRQLTAPINNAIAIASLAKSIELARTKESTQESASAPVGP